MGVGLYSPALSYSQNIFCLLQGCRDIDALIMTEGRQEPYIAATETDENVQYHIHIESQCLISDNSLGDRDALADRICTYFVFNIYIIVPKIYVCYTDFSPAFYF